MKPTLTLLTAVLLAPLGSLRAADSPFLAAGPQPQQKSPLRDKTLVAWVAPATLTQRGGSVLTIIDNQERFDAIVFGERVAGRWMAGSDFFRRTPADQQAYPPETADADTVVQVAVAYQGNHIRIYRNGEPYAQYQVEEPQAFTTDDTVLIGLRYVGGMGEIGFFHGTVEEARLYDRALDAEAIARLAPGRPSDPEPIGLWTFLDGSASDVMGTFPEGRLFGNARIADGRLHLDGRTGYVEIARERPSTAQAMFYRPYRRDTGRMWDVWLYLHEGTYYLFYLANRPSNRWDNISLATSPDGVHWTEHGPILTKRDDAVWMGTGSTWRSPDYDTDKKFFLNFSEERGPQQTIFFAESKDLLHWTRLDDRYEFKPDPRWYNVDRGNNSRWDCIYTIAREGGGLYGYWTATPKDGTGGRFGFGESEDGVTWKALPPPRVEGVGHGEVGAIEPIGDRCYMMFGAGGRMVTLVAERPEGPFRAAERNFNLLTGHTYFSRFFPTPDGVLVSHHSIARDGPVYFAPLKATHVDAQGTLRLVWWNGNEPLKHEPVEVETPAPTGEAAPAIAMLEPSFDVDRGVVMEGIVALPAPEEAGRSGLYVEFRADRGTAILLGAAGKAELGPLGADGTDFTAEKRVDREMQFGRTARFRLLLKHSLLEFYLDDVLIECFSLPGRATGRIGLIGHRDGRPVKDIRAWHCRLPEQ
jgi:hypothetical protein